MPPVEDGTKRFMELLDGIKYAQDGSSFFLNRILVDFQIMRAFIIIG